MQISVSTTAITNAATAASGQEPGLTSLLGNHANTEAVVLRELVAVEHLWPRVAVAVHVMLAARLHAPAQRPGT